MTSTYEEYAEKAGRPVSRLTAWFTACDHLTETQRHTAEASLVGAYSVDATDEQWEHATAYALAAAERTTVSRQEDLEDFYHQASPEEAAEQAASDGWEPGMPMGGRR